MKAPQAPISIAAIKTDVCYFTQNANQTCGYSGHGLSDYLYDGKKAQPTFHPKWLKIAKPPKKIEIEVKQLDINYRFVLVDKTLESPKFPLSFTRESVCFYNEKDYYWQWKTEFTHLSSLYKEVSDPVPNALETVPFDFKVVCEIDNIKEYAGFSYLTQKTHWISDGKVNLTNKDVSYQGIDRIVFPDVVLPSRPSVLSSEQSYGIIREFVKTHINPKVAEVTSDYDFCFTVCKKVKIATPYTHIWDDKVGRKTVKRSRFVSDRRVEIFEMTHTGSNYKGYTPISGFRGKNHEDLRENIDKFLKDLIADINKPIEECQCCKGMGVVVPPVECRE